MPLGIAASDRKLLLIGGTLLVLMLAVSVLLAPPGEQFDSPVPSTYSTQSGGAQAAYLLLSQLHYPVRRWEDAPTELPSNPNGVLLILAAPLQFPSAKERNALLDFVTGGGHVLFTGSSVQAFFKDADVSSVIPEPRWKTFSPSLPSRVARGAANITIQAQAYWGRLNESQLVLYGEADSAVVVAWNLGKGHVLWWAGSTPLTNAGITREENLTFFLNCVAKWPAAHAYQIYWDEYFHGQRSSLWNYFGKTSLVWGLFQLCVLAVAVLFSFSRRSGPVFLPRSYTRLSPLEFVDTLGGLYERAQATPSAVSISYLRLRSLLTRQLSLPSKTSDAELGLAAEQRLGWKNLGITELLQRAEVCSRMVKLSPHEALEVVQKLEQHIARLSLRAPYRWEKK